MKASIILPVYNQVESLLLCLKYFSNQNIPSNLYEVIIVDDGSEDELKYYDSSSSVFSQNAFKIKVIHQKNAGRSVARNIGVENASSECIIFCDGDRLPAADFVSKHICHHQNYENSAVFGIPYDYFGLKSHIENMDFEKIIKFSRTSTYYKKISVLYDSTMHSNSGIAWMTFLVGNSSMTRDVFYKAGGFSSDFIDWGFEHYDLALRLMNNNIKIMHDSSIKSFHIPHKRENTSYRESIKDSVKILCEKHKNENIILLEKFLFGEISLQDFEKNYTACEYNTFEFAKPIYYTNLK